MIETPSTRVRRRVRRRAPFLAAFLAATVCLAVAASSSAQSPDLLLRGLQPAGRYDPGCGSDAFRSSVLGQSGWWRQEPFDSGLDLRLRQRSDTPATRRMTDGDGRLEALSAAIDAGWTLDHRGQRLLTGFRAETVRTSLEWRGDLADLKLRSEGARLDGIVRAENVLPGLDAQLTFPIATSEGIDSPAALRGGFRLSLADRLIPTTSWWVRRDDRSLAVVLEDETVRPPSNVHETGFEHAIRIAPWRSLAVEVSVGEREIEADEDLTGFGEEFLPALWTGTRQQTVSWRSERGLGLLLRHADFRLLGSGAGYMEGSRYTRLSHWNVRTESTLAAAECRFESGRRVRAEVERVDADAFGRADVDSWRFAAWQEAWLGAKKVFELTVSGRWERYGLAGEMPWSDGELGAALGWYEIYPDARVDSWIRIPFTRPQDFERSDLETSHLSLGVVSLRMQRELGQYRLDLDLTQFVYADDHAASTSAPSVPGEPGTSNEHGGWFGGTFAGFSVGTRF